MIRFRFPILVALSAVLLAAPASAQVFGFFEGPVNGNVATGVVPLTGWALTEDPAGIRRVVVQVDGVDVGQARYGRPRPDVETTFPGRTDSAAAGFAYNLDSTPYTNEVHTVSVKVEAQNGEVKILNSYHLLFQNSASLLVPFGRIEAPDRNAVVYGNCVARPPFGFDDSICDDDGLSPGDQALCDASARRYVVVEGWALDLGDVDSAFNDAGISYVELLIDGAIYANSRRDCTYVAEAGGFSNCYGLPRQDIEAFFPFAPNAPNAGFRFVVDVGALIAEFGRTQGAHTFTIRAGDLGNQVANIDEFPVFWSCIQNIDNEPSFGLIEVPRPGRFYSGAVKVEGWALDGEGVNAVEVWVDGQLVTEADYGVDARPSVAEEYPGFPDSAAPVFRAFIDSTELVDGVHQIQVYVRDGTMDGDNPGSRVLIGETTFVVENNVDNVP